MIRKVRGGWIVLSESGRKLSKVYKDMESAKKRLREIEYFKRKK